MGVFCHTGGGKSYLTSMIVRKALKAIEDLKVVIFDVSAEYVVHLLDQLVDSPSRIVTAKRGSKRELETDPDKSAIASAADFYNRHVKPDALEAREPELKSMIETLFKQGKPKSMFIAPNYLSGIAFYRSYEGLLESLEQTASEKYNANQQASIYVIDRIRAFLHDSNKDESEPVDKDILPLLAEIQAYFASAGLRTNSTLYGLIKGLQERLKQDVAEPEDLGYSLDSFVSELLDDSKESPSLFVVDEEIETSRELATKIIEEVFRRRRSSFKLRPRILFVFDEAQEFVPGGDSTRSSGEALGECSKAVEKLLRHGRKYHLHGWISTQRLAYLNTNALHQLHSYFVGTLPRPYDRQLVGDTFAIDDALLERTLNFAPGDWLLASYRGTNTQNVPVFFHAINNEESILPPFEKTEC